MKELKGSEKQVAWATQIRDAVFATLDRADAQRGDRFYTIDGDLKYLSPEAVDALRAEYTALFNKIDSASLIIDKLSLLSPEHVIKHGRDWMWHNGQRDSRGQLPR